VLGGDAAGGAGNTDRAVVRAQHVMGCVGWAGGCGGVWASELAWW
jgi:hypothetical protein